MYLKHNFKVIESKESWSVIEKLKIKISNFLFDDESNAK